MTTADSQGPSESNPDPPAAFNYVIDHIDALSPRPDFWIFGGDAYYSASDSADAMAHWQTWKDRIDQLSDITLYLAIGNHDANNYGYFYGPWHGNGERPFRASWPGLPQNGPAGYVGTAYSFRFGNSLFCVVNTNPCSAATYAATYRVDAVQRNWLAGLLDTTSATHKFVVGHAEAWPPSNSSSSSLQWNAADREAFWSVMAGHGVGAYICGHIHLWNRDYFAASGYGNAPADTSVRQVVCGGAGGSLVSGYGGNYYHFVVWDVDGPSVVARVVDSYGNLRDSIKYSVPSGVSGQQPEELPQVRAVRNVRFAGGRIMWDAYQGPVRVDVYNVSGQRLWSGRSSGGSAAWGRPSASGSARVPSGLYLVRVRPDGEVPGATGKVLIIR